jgi:hypothetical protein
VLKKAGIVVATAAAGLLAVSPLAFAGDKAPQGKDSHGGGHYSQVDVTDQENEQESAQGNGILNGNNVHSGNSIQVCKTQVSALNNVLGAVIPVLATVTNQANQSQEDGDCTSQGTAVGQTTEQEAANND